MRAAELIQEIAADERAGAAEMIERAARAFALLVDETAGRANPRAAVLDACRALAGAQPRMAPVARLAGEALRAADRAPAGEAARQAARAAEDFLARVRNGGRAAARRAAALIAEGATILTHSRSSTVLEAFLEARRAGRAFRVIATESRPLGEGRALAEELAGAGVATTFIADAAAALALPGADFALVGADALTPQELINKIGTRMIALAARQSGRSVYAVCDMSKFISALPAGESPRDPAQLWPDPPPGVTVLNRYFEPTPLEWLTAVVTEDGPLEPAEAARRAATLAYLRFEI